ncbi:MAG: hypothetical protein RLY31_1046 [Bacteroidota bacterium]|jgi:predicted unusual protein kinase regulating ubiquinone biosynthesis (AarF/ABC1/UbiB family)
MRQPDLELRPARRARKAYLVAARVLWSYAWLWWRRRLFGERYYERRIESLHTRNAHRIKDAILTLNGLFIKVGQLLSVTGNFLPEAFHQPLESLQDRIPARPFTQVRERLTQEFGREPETVFRHVDPEPIAAASIGQAHRAILPDGTEVVVKVQHIDIETIAMVDLVVIRRLTRFAAWVYDIKGMDFFYTQVEQLVREELDFTREAAAQTRIAANLAGEAGVIVPAVHPAWSTGRVLTTTWQEGVKISRTDQIDHWGIDRPTLARRVLRLYCKMLFQDAFYHADPHPGNLLVNRDGNIILLDFGAVSTLGEPMRKGIPRMVEATIGNDTQAMLQAARDMGFLAEGPAADALAERIIATLRNFLEQEIELEGLTLVNLKVNPLDSSLFGLMREIGRSGLSGTVQIPRDWVLLNRMASLLLGLVATLDPKLNPLETVRPYIREFVRQEKQDLLSLATGYLRRTATTALGLPDELHRVLLRIDRNQLQTRTPDILEGARLLYLAGQQFVLTLLAISAAVFGYLFYLKADAYATRWGFGLSFIFLAMLLRNLRTGRRIKRNMGLKDRP